jgi:hypothetical protein
LREEPDGGEIRRFIMSNGHVLAGAAIVTVVFGDKS